MCSSSAESACSTSAWSFSPREALGSRQSKEENATCKAGRIRASVVLIPEPHGF